MATTWAQGNYARMAWRLRPAAARVVEVADVASGDAVLDVACGTRERRAGRGGTGCLASCWG